MALLGHPLQGFSDGDLVDSLPLGPASGDDGPLLEGSLPDPSPDNDVALFRLVSECPCPVEPGRALDAGEVLLLAPLNPALVVQSLDIGLLGDVPGLADVVVHALPVNRACLLLLSFFAHWNHLYGFTVVRHISVHGANAPRLLRRPCHIKLCPSDITRIIRITSITQITASCLNFSSR